MFNDRAKSEEEFRAVLKQENSISWGHSESSKVSSKESLKFIQKQTYITEMLRWGEEETHHYIVGVYSSREAAVFAGEIEKTWRGGKYDYQVVEVELNAALDQEKYEYHTSCKG